MEKETSESNIFNIGVAKRKYLKSNNIQKYKIFIFLTFTSSIFFLIFLIFDDRFLVFENINSSRMEKVDGKILGHFPYNETSAEDLIRIQPNIYVHKEMYAELLKMQEDAEKDGVFLIFLSGYRSIALQREIFYSLKSMRNQVAAERAKVSAPPGFSEHSTGFAIDIGDASNRQTDFEVTFEKTEAFIWLKENAAKYHFKLSFDKDHNTVDYEPWHWRYEGSINALKTFEASNRNSRQKR